MGRSASEFVVLGVVCSVAVLATTVGPAIATTKKLKEPAPAVVVAKPAKQQSVPGQTPSIHRAKKSPLPAAAEHQSETIQKPVKAASTRPKLMSPKSSQSVSTEHQPEAIQVQTKLEQTELKPTKPRSLRRTKVHRKKAPEAVVQPRTDLMYHGMLESPQRYDPRRNQLGAGVPDPRTSELTHDHFQELDRNQDGTIDPVERTFGRLDMDRDLYDRRPR